MDLGLNEKQLTAFKFANLRSNSYQKNVVLLQVLASIYNKHLIRDMTEMRYQDGTSTRAEAASYVGESKAMLCSRNVDASRIGVILNGELF